ncbi:U32 family peptidase [bacterium]|nr:U32 family peptidase [bacterium]
MKYPKPELLAPAGSMEKLQVAFAYGADAVYLGGQAFNLRQAAHNFDLEQLKEAVVLANKLKKKVYLTLNALPSNEEIKALPAYLQQIEKIKPHALIIADFGVLSLAKKYTTIPIHISTQACVTNAEAIKFYQDLGVQRVILARELTLEEIKKIKKQVTMDLEIFCHGSMCAGYSGKCHLSTYLSGRDSNRGFCVQNCRHKFNLYDEHKQLMESAFLMNSRDMMTIRLLPQIMELGISSLKIEGRMRSNLYLANTVAVYRKLIDNPIEGDLKKFEEQLEKVSNRSFTDEYLQKRLGKKSINYDWGGYLSKTEYLGLVKEVDEKGDLFVQVKAPFEQGEGLELIRPKASTIKIKIDKIYNMANELITRTRPNSLVRIPCKKKVAKLAILSRKD